MFTGFLIQVCPNNKEYRAYVKENLQELNRNYKFEGMFLDMTFWTDVCFCPSCRERYLAETGRELPRMVDWKDPDFKEYAYIREQWLADYARFATSAVKEINPAVTIEHQFSMITSPWINASSELLMEAVDCASGDYYGGFLQQTFINKYYKNVSPCLPFVYHTSRCDPELMFHTTTKTKEELLLHVITALVHNGAFLLVDAINPDGTIVPEIYYGLIKEIYDITKPYENYVNGNIKHNAAVWFASHAKYDPDEADVTMEEKSFNRKIYMEAPVSATAVLRENNIAYDVIGSKNIVDETAEVLILSHVSNIRENEMDAIEAYIEKGKNLFISGPIGNKRIEKLLGVKIVGKTEHTFTYMSPTEVGEVFFEDFSRKVPLTITSSQYRIEIEDDTDCVVLATLTLPYTMTGTEQFSAIHSNPPGIYTDQPCAIRKRIGNSVIIWTAAPIEMTQPYASRQVFCRMIRSLCGLMKFTSNAPKFVEIINWEKGGNDYFALINQQEESPVAPMYDLFVKVKGEGRKGRMLPDKEELKTESSEGFTKIYLPRLDVFQIFVLE